MASKVGTLEIRLTHENENWGSDDLGYHFGPFGDESVQLEAVKHANRRIDIKFTGPGRKTFVFHHDLQKLTSTSKKGLYVVVLWNEEGVTLRLNKDEIETKPLDQGM